MARRLDVELTSRRADDTLTWRAAGAKHPKGELDASLLPEGVGVGDVVRVEAEADLEGLTVTTVFAPKGPRAEAERIELIRSEDSEAAVTATLTSKRRSRGSGYDKGNGGQRRSKARDRSAKPAPRDGRRRRKQDPDRADRRRRDKETVVRQRPKGPPSAPRLRAGRTHRKAALDALPEDQRELAEEVLRGGVPGVRDALERMNALAKAEGIPEIKGKPLVTLAEKLAPTLKAAEWLDRAEAAEAGLDEIDLRDLRSVVSAADSGARSAEAASLAERLRVGLSGRVEAEHRAWLNDLAGIISEGRAVRALRVSSRPPKAGSPLPVDLAKRLAELASSGLTADESPKRWAMLLEAIAFSPVRTQVTAQAVPAAADEELLDTVRKLAPRVPELAALFDIEPVARKRRRRRTAPPPPPPEQAAAEPGAAGLSTAGEAEADSKDDTEGVTDAGDERP